MTEIRFNYTPTDKQQVAHKLPHKYKLFGGAIGGGKTVWLCAEAIYLSLAYPGNRILMCRKHLTDFKNSTLVTLFRLLPPELIREHNKAECRITLINNSVILYMGLGNAEEVEKLRSLEISSAMLDEATEVPYEGFLMLQQRVNRWTLQDGTRPPEYILLASNPDDGWVKEKFIDAPAEQFAFIQSLPTDNPHLAEDYIPNLRKTYPEEWVNRFLDGDWNALTTGDKIIPYDWVKSAINREITVVNKRIVSCDPAAFGDDETVIGFGIGNSLIKINTYLKQDPMVSCGEYLRMYKDNRADRGIIEVDGLGVGIYSRLKEMGLKISSFRSGSEALNKDRFFKLKTEAWFHARELFETGNVSIPNDSKLIHQLSSVRYRTRGSSGQLWVEPKDTYKSRMHKSPDRADMLIMMLWLSKQMRDPVNDYKRVRSLSEINNPAYTQNPYGWNKHYVQ